jgi:beta-N-acetylhexosaminidase
MNAQFSPQQVKMVKQLNETGIPLAAVSLRTPYDLASFPEIQNHVAIYEFTPVAADVAVEGIFGKTKLQGHLPVTIPGVAKRGHRAKMRGEA